VSPESRDIGARSVPQTTHLKNVTTQRTSATIGEGYCETMHLVGSFSVATEPLDKVFTTESSKNLLKGIVRIRQAESEPESPRNQLENIPDTVSMI
jgi:hypothetical protein